MHITVTTLSDQIFSLDVSEDLELENFKALCEYEIGISASEIAILWNGRPLHDDKRTLTSYGIKNGDMLLLQHMRGPSQAPNSPQQSAPGLFIFIWWKYTDSFSHHSKISNIYLGKKIEILFIWLINSYNWTRNLHHYTAVIKKSLFGNNCSSLTVIMFDM